MLSTVLLTATTLLASQALRAPPGQAESWAPTGEPFCEIEEEAFDPVASYATDTLAPVGGAWWLHRKTEFFTDDELLDDPDRLELVAGDGSLLELDLHVTPSALALRVPEDASEGATYLLRDRLDPGFGRVLEVGPPTERQVAPHDIELQASTPRLAQCFAECDDGLEYSVPAAPTFTIAFDGAPVILDVWHRTPSDALSFDPNAPLLSRPRRIDSRLVEAGAHAFEADQATGQLGTDLRVELRDPLTLELLHEADLSLQYVQSTFDNDDLIACEAINNGQPDDPTYGGGCHSVGGSVPSAFGLLLLGLGARRRRRRA